MKDGACLVLDKEPLVQLCIGVRLHRANESLALVNCIVDFFTPQVVTVVFETTPPPKKTDQRQQTDQQKTATRFPQRTHSECAASPLPAQMQAHFIQSGTRSEQEYLEKICPRGASFSSPNREGARAGQDIVLRTGS